MNRKQMTVAFAALAVANVGAVCLPITRADAAAAKRADDWFDRLIGRRKNVEASRLIPWSHATGRPDLSDGRGEGFYIWHDRNTVHVWVRGGDRKRREFRGWIEIQNGKIDSLQDEHTERDDEFRQVTERRVLFALEAGEKPHGFRFNIKPGERLTLQLEAEGRRTDRVFLGKTMAESRGNPVTFDLRK
jgi:hypothetical protein